MDEAQLAVRSAVRTASADRPDRVLVACSGGPDSIALLDATLWVGERDGFEVSCCIVDHGLHPDSEVISTEVANVARALGCGDVHVMRVEVRTDGDGLEAAARDARRAALRECASALGADAIYLGHTREDQAETVLMRLARGSGARSLSAMASRDGKWRRPFLELPRATVHAAAAGLATWTDPMNLDPAFTRSRVRTELLPVLTKVLGPGAVLGLARSAELARADADALEAIAGEVPVQPGEPLDVAVLLALPMAVRTRVIRRWLDAPIEFEHLRSVERLVSAWHGQGPVSLPRGVKVSRDCERLVVTIEERQPRGR